MPHEVVNQKSMASNAERFLGETRDLFWFKVMNKEGRADNIKAVITKRQGQCVAADSGMGVAHVRRRAI